MLNDMHAMSWPKILRSDMDPDSRRSSGDLLQQASELQHLMQRACEVQRALVAADSHQQRLQEGAGMLVSWQTVGQSRGVLALHDSLHKAGQMFWVPHILRCCDWSHCAHPCC